MKIAYGVMGYGRGHAMRTSAVLPELMKHHDVRVFAGRDAYQSMKGQFDVTRIPTIGWRYNSQGTIAPFQTIRHNIVPMADVLFGGSGTAKLQQDFEHWNPDLVISDSEAWTHRVARKYGIPRISFDHVGIIAYCNPPLPYKDWWNGHRDAWGYRTLMGRPERILVSSFYPAVPRYSGVELCGPVLRDAVYAQHHSDRGHLLAYFNKGDQQYLPHVESALQQLELPIIVYGTSRLGCDGQIQYKAASQEGFIEDLSACHALLSTAGNQLISEATFFEKPMFLMPENCFEQRLNAFMVQRLGYGIPGNLLTVSHENLLVFLENRDVYKQRMQGQFRDGRQEAQSHLEGFIAELSKRRSPWQKQCRHRTTKTVVLT